MISAYSVYDDASKSYSDPLFFVNDDVAIRAFTATVKPGSLLFDYPEDYTLVRVADFDPNTGIFDSYDPRVIIDAKTVVQRFKENSDEDNL